MIIKKLIIWCILVLFVPALHAQFLRDACKTLGGAERVMAILESNVSESMMQPLGFDQVTQKIWDSLYESYIHDSSFSRALHIINADFLLVTYLVQQEGKLSEKELLLLSYLITAEPTNILSVYDSTWDGSLYMDHREVLDPEWDRNEFYDLYVAVFDTATADKEIRRFSESYLRHLVETQKMSLWEETRVTDFVRQTYIETDARRQLKEFEKRLNEELAFLFTKDIPRYKIIKEYYYPSPKLGFEDLQFDEDDKLIGAGEIVVDKEYVTFQEASLSDMLRAKTTKQLINTYNAWSAEKAILFKTERVVCTMKADATGNPRIVFTRK